MPTVLSKNVLERAGWTAAQALAALAIVELANVKVWWAAPVAMALSALKTGIVDHYADKPVDEEVGP